ncbi:MAG: hypothetical protein M1608_14180 [Candidatus Omnitrophica bacterium]|nr:hypothetical protein [Candidatus Omnitrophota bacterium]
MDENVMRVADAIKFASNQAPGCITRSGNLKRLNRAREAWDALLPAGRN